MIKQVELAPETISRSEVPPMVEVFTDKTTPDQQILSGLGGNALRSTLYSNAAGGFIPPEVARHLAGHLNSRGVVSYMDAHRALTPDGRPLNVRYKGE